MSEPERARDAVGGDEAGPVTTASTEPAAEGEVRPEPAEPAGADPTAAEPAEADATAAEPEVEAAPTPAGVPAKEPTAAVDAPPATTVTTAEAFIQEALVPPRAIEDVATFVPRPGSPAAEPSVQAAKAEAEAARAALAIEIGRLRQAGRDAVDVKAKVKGMPAAIAREPAKFLGLGAASAAGGVLVSRLRRGRKKAMPPGMLPPEVEAALESVGPDQDKVRDALNAGFTRFLEAEGAQAASPRRKVPGLIPLFILPVASTIAREAIKRLVAGPQKR